MRSSPEQASRRATLYRRWATKEELIIRCLQARAAQDNPPSTGDWRADIEQAVESMITLVNTDAGRAMVAVTAAAYGNIDLSVLFTRDDPDGPVGSLRKALEQGIGSGDLRADLDVDLMMDLLVATISFRMTVLNEEVPAGLSKRIVDVVIDGARAKR